MSTKKKEKDRRAKSLRRRTWGLRMALWSALLLGGAGALAFVLLSDSGGGGSGSRFTSIHKFDTADYHSLAFSPTQDGLVLFGHHNGLQVSEDDGQTWTKVIDQPNWDAMNLVYDPFSSGTVYMSGHNVSYRSEDGAGTWNEVDSDLPGLDLHVFAASPSQRGRLYTFAVGYGLYVSDDGGREWRILSDEVPQGTAALQELPDGTLLLAAFDAGMLRSEDGGKTWTPSRQGIDTGAIFTVRADPVGTRVYAGTNRGLFVSIDGGRSWSATALDDTLALVVGVNPSDPMEVMVIDGEGRLYRTGDGGETW